MPVIIDAENTVIIRDGHTCIPYHAATVYKPTKPPYVAFSGSMYIVRPVICISRTADGPQRARLYQCNVAILLPTVPKDLPTSPRFSPTIILYLDSSSALLDLNKKWLNIISSRSPAFFLYGSQIKDPVSSRIERTTPKYQAAIYEVTTTVLLQSG